VSVVKAGLFVLLQKRENKVVNSNGIISVADTVTITKNIQ